MRGGGTLCRRIECETSLTMMTSTSRVDAKVENRQTADRLARNEIRLRGRVHNQSKRRFAERSKHKETTQLQLLYLYQ